MRNFLKFDGTRTRTILASLLAAGVIGIASMAPASAQVIIRHDEHRHHHRPPERVYVAPQRVYVPPPVVYAAPQLVYEAPPPVVYAPPALGLSINIR